MSKQFPVKGLPWSGGFGTNVTDCKTARDVMEKAKLDFVVQKCPLVAKMGFSINSKNTFADDDDESFAYKGHMYRECPNAFATYRTDFNVPLGIVKEKYEVIQNTEAFNFFDDAIGPDKAIWQTAGYFGEGHKIFVCAKLPVDITVKGDKVDNYLVFSNSHDGSASINILFTPIRVICFNMLNSAINSADSYIRIRHTQSARDKIQTGADILRIACEHANTTQQLYDALATIKMSDEEVMRYISRLNLTDAERQTLEDYDPKNGYNKLFKKDYLTLEKTNISIRKINKIVSMYEYYHTGAGQNQIMGTAWGAYNAVTGYYSNVDNTEGRRRMDTLLYGSANRSMGAALKEAM